MTASAVITDCGIYEKQMTFCQEQKGKQVNEIFSSAFYDLLIYMVSNPEICFSDRILSASKRSGLWTECVPVWVSLVRVSVACTWSRAISKLNFKNTISGNTTVHA